MPSMHYVGLDVHKKTIAYCVKTRSGQMRGEGTIEATRAALDAWVAERKQRNKHLQSTLIEAANLAPIWNPRLAAIHERMCARGNKNRATLEVARRLVSLMLAIDKSGEPYDPGRN